MKSLLSLALTLVFTASLSAQSATDAAIDRAQQGLPQNNTPTAGASSQSYSESSDTGVQRLATPRSFPFKLSVALDSQVNYTSNVYLTHDDHKSATVVSNTAQIRADGNTIALGDGLLNFNASLVYQRYNHGLHTNNANKKALDFDAYSLPLSARYRFGENWEANAGITSTILYRLNGTDRYRRIYESYTPSVGLRKTIGLAPGRVLSFSGNIGYALTKTDTAGLTPITTYRDDRNDKMDYAVDVAYYHVSGKWIFSPRARLSFSDYSHYENSGSVSVVREDLTFNAGVTATYNFCPNATARLFVGYDSRGSKLYLSSYESKNLGAGISLNYSF